MEHLIPIRKIAEVLDAPEDTLRSWERRHSIFTPRRTPSGHRRYSQEDLETAQLLKHYLDNGMRIGKAVRAVKKKRARERIPKAQNLSPIWRNYLEDALSATAEFNLDALDRAFQQTLSSYPPDRVMTRLTIPMFEILERERKQQPTAFSEQHFIGNYLINKLNQRLIHETSHAKGHRVMVCGLPEERHEIGLLLFCLTMISEQIHPIYLGVGLPPDQLLAVQKITACRGIVMAGQRHLHADGTLRALQQVVQASSVPIFIGGQFCEHNKTAIEKGGMIPIGKEFRGAIASIIDNLDA